MKAIVFIFCFIFSMHSFANNIIVNGTRFIYPGNEKEITVQLNNTADRPAIAQAWLDTGDASETPDTIKTPFQITPPISRVEAKGGQTLRIKLMDKGSIPQDRESLWWLNILDIPPVAKGKDGDNQNVLQLAIRSRFKFFYRPTGLGSRELAPEQLVIKSSGKNIIIDNPTPYYITVTKISTDGESGLNDKTVLLEPKSQTTVELIQAVRSGSNIVINNINDYGSDIAVKTTVK
ncbi:MULTISPECIES: molecular chaperone [Providencia]|uniref:fimbrial biogenesis chaperone n=1 Tax=Providencia TaxID=586 RepID=UPI001C5AF0F7|nr:MULTISPECIES: fimbria/pilus periplasmic chaperone [Providencia]ELR5150918.1 fimbria/pilus periplasmic chaperone [Providencia rettgeri]MDR2226615.1 fimbria/pilus periplasmic chaperone [Providencia sp.]QXX84303.1 fimbria/pilus periplasmic chaperone [Providencia sp. R33]